MAKDPLGFGGREASMYVYVNDDPVNFRDPSGRIIEAGGTVGPAIVAELAANPTIGPFVDQLESNQNFTVYIDPSPPVPDLLDPSMQGGEFEPDPYDPMHFGYARYVPGYLNNTCGNDTRQALLEYFAHELGHAFAWTDIVGPNGTPPTGDDWRDYSEQIARWFEAAVANSR